MRDHDYDLCIVGAGSAGYAAAVTARDLGKSAAFVDGRGELAGLCILRGCMPSKTLLRSAEVAHEVRNAGVAGVVTPPPQIDFAAVMARKRRIIKEFADYRVEGIERFPLFRGQPSFVGPDAVRVDGRTVRARRFVIATGSIVNVPDIPGLQQTGYLTSDDILELDALPRSVIVLGGGLVACELAQYLARLGVETSILQRSKKLLSYEDPEVGEVLQLCFEREGIPVLTGTTITLVEKTPHGKRVHFQREGRSESLSAQEVFAALGRRANVEGFGLEAAGVEHTRLGVKVDAFLQTSNPAIYAAGDVVYASSQLVHVAVHQGQLAARNALSDERRPADERQEQARAVFTDPQVAVAGLTERHCRQRNIEHAVASFPFSDLGKAISTDRTDGFVKMIAAPDGAILGVALVGAEASDMIHEAIALVHFGANVRDVLSMPHLHPTLAEIMTYPAEELCERLEHERHALVTP